MRQTCPSQHEVRGECPPEVVRGNDQAHLCSATTYDTRDGEGCQPTPISLAQEQRRLIRAPFEKRFPRPLEVCGDGGCCCPGQGNHPLVASFACNEQGSAPHIDSGEIDLGNLLAPGAGRVGEFEKSPVPLIDGTNA